MEQRYRSPRWLPGGNAQTIWPALFGAATTASRWRSAANAGPRRTPISSTPTGWATDPNAPLLVMFHGLEGSTRSHYAQAFADWARQHGWRFVLPHFRGCSGESEPRAARAYHSGDFEEIGWMLAQAKARHAGPLVAVGVSLGGNALLRWAEEAGDTAAATARAVAAISSPIDLAAGGSPSGAASTAWSTRMFLRTMKLPALAKLAQHPGLFSRELLAARIDLYEFDDVFTAPLHGFRNTDDYWARGSANRTCPHPHPGAGAQRAQRSLRAGRELLAGGARGRLAGDAVAARARRPRRLPGRRWPGPM